MPHLMRRLTVASALLMPTFMLGSQERTAWADIGPDGGEIQLGDGRARLVVPRGALRRRVRVGLRVLDQAPLDPMHVVGSAVRVVIRAEFTTSAILTITYDPDGRPSGTPESELGVAELSGGAWAPRYGIVTVVSHSATVSVSRAGTFGVRWRPPSTPCIAPGHRQFDFWLGSWSLSAVGAPTGFNSIVADSSGCAISEHFRQEGYVGRSVTVLSSTDGKWHQTYMDVDGDRTIYTGGEQDGAMVLYEGASRRLNWRQLDDRRIRHFVEQSNDGGASWRVVYDGLYTRRPSPPDDGIIGATR
jgi:hypothetical protein